MARADGLLSMIDHYNEEKYGTTTPGMLEIVRPTREEVAVFGSALHKPEAVAAMKPAPKEPSMIDKFKKVMGTFGRPSGGSVPVVEKVDGLTGLFGGAVSRETARPTHGDLFGKFDPVDRSRHDDYAENVLAKKIASVETRVRELSPFMTGTTTASSAHAGSKAIDLPAALASLSKSAPKEMLISDDLATFVADTAHSALMGHDGPISPLAFDEEAVIRDRPKKRPVADASSADPDWGSW